MEITKDTPISELYHSDDLDLEHAIANGADIRYVDLDEDELFHWKYLKREKLPNGKWRYYYDWNELKNDAKNLGDQIASGVKKAVDTVAKKTEDFVLDRANKAAKSIDSLVTNAKTAINSFFDDPNNKYDITSSSYKTKVEKVKESDEWKEIVARQDPEYVKKNKDGTTKYLIDDYIVDKKHPVLDALGDIISGREVKVNEITAESTIAGLKDYAMGTIRSGVLGVTVLTTFLNEKFKFQQGTYDAEVMELMDSVQRGQEYIDDVAGMINSTIDNTKSAAGGVYSTAKVASELTGVAAGTLGNQRDSSVSRESVEKLASFIAEQAKNTEPIKAFNEGNVVQAAQMIMQSDVLKSTLGNNEYYKMTESVLSDLSPAEIEALNLMLKQLRS